MRAMIARWITERKTVVVGRLRLRGCWDEWARGLEAQTPDHWRVIGRCVVG